jgi:hypothetical protein
MSSRKLFSIFSNSYTITFSSFDHTIPVPATIVAENGGTFDIRMFLKYSDQTAEEFFNQNGKRLEPDQPLTIEATPRPEDNPFQVNIFVNGLPAIGQAYRASVVGCL